jgi:hypothetical protein
MIDYTFPSAVIGIFTGTFDGAGHKIHNLTIDTAGGGNSYLGLFGKIIGEQEQVKDLGLENVSVITGNGSRYIGGLCGYNREGPFSNCYTIGSIVSGDGSLYVGGLCGNNSDGGFTNCYSKGSIRVGNDVSEVGLLYGRNTRGPISNCYASGSVAVGNGASEVGGLCGVNNRGPISHSYSTCSVSAGSDSQQLGGLCGVYFYISLDSCYATGSVSSGDRSIEVGGLCGMKYGGPVNNCYATGSVLGGIESERIGGLFGGSAYDSVNNCYSVGSVEAGAGSLQLGGLCGFNNSVINNSYAKGSVAGGEGSQYIGGLWGWGGSSAYYCYSVGAVTAGAGSTYVGGFCGRIGSVNNCFWDIETSGMTDGIGNNPYPSGVIGLTTEDMQKIITYTDAGWDFGGEETNGTDDIWRMCVDGIGYPHLFHQYNVSGDFACPDGVGIEDLLALSSNWLNTEELDPDFSYPCDPTFDGITNLADYAILSENWLRGIVPLAHWNFDGDYTDSADGYDGTPVGDPNLVTNDVKVGTGAVELDGIDDYVEIAGFKGIPGGSSRTCTAWIKTSTAPGEIITWGTTDTTAKWIVRLDNTGPLRAEVSGGYIIGTKNLADDTWHHVAVVLAADGSSDVSEIKLYVDGEEEVITTSSACSVNTSAGNLVRIGVFSTFSRFFQGLMDDVRIYARPLTADEVAELAN